MGSFNDGLQLMVTDSTWDVDTRTVKKLWAVTATGFVSKIPSQGLLEIHPDLRRSLKKKEKIFSDKVMKRIEETMDFRNKEGKNPTPVNPDSNVTDGNSTTGASTNQLVTITSNANSRSCRWRCIDLKIN